MKVEARPQDAVTSWWGRRGNKKWDSLHCSVAEAELAPHRDKWEVVERSLSPSDNFIIFCGSLHMEENGLYFGAESL